MNYAIAALAAFGIIGILIANAVYQLRKADNADNQ